MASKTVIRITGKTHETIENGDLAFWLYLDDGRAVQCAPKRGSEVRSPKCAGGQSMTLEGEFSDELQNPKFPLFRFHQFELQFSPTTVIVDFDAGRSASPV